MEVPLDHADPDGPQISLAVARRPATSDEPLGVLLVNPGGPAGSGVELLRAGFEVAPEVAERFDLVSWDPRGAGASTAISCGGPTIDRWLTLDPDPDDEAERAALQNAAEAVADECAETDLGLLPHVSTEDVVRDVDRIREALGADQISYLGLSYGTLIGLLYLEAHPDRVRAMVLDGVVDPSGDLVSFTTAQALAFERALERLFASCEKTEQCPLEDPARAWDEVARRVEGDPLPVTSGGEVGPAELQLAAVYAGYDPADAPSFLQALAEARAGDGTGLRQLAERYLSFGAFGPYVSVLCVDWPHPGPAGFETLAAELASQAPRFGEALGYELLPCAYWPVDPARDPAPVVAPGSPPVLVVGNTGDAATPYAQAVRVAEDLAAATLLTYEGEGHLSLNRSQCVDDWISVYLVELESPPPGAVC